MGRNCQFQNSAVTRCAQNSQICETHSHLRNWVKCVNSHKLQGPDLKILQFHHFMTPFAKLGINCQKCETAGTRFDNFCMFFKLAKLGNLCYFLKRAGTKCETVNLLPQFAFYCKSFVFFPKSQTSHLNVSHV